jgi:hypothetical protein
MREPTQPCMDKLWHRNPILQDRMLLRDAECNESCTAMAVDSPESPVSVAGKHTITPGVSRQILPALSKELLGDKVSITKIPITAGNGRRQQLGHEVRSALAHSLHN